MLEIKERLFWVLLNLPYVETDTWVRTQYLAVFKTNGLSALGDSLI